MTREELNFVLKQNACLEDGTKQACIKIKKFIQDAHCTDTQINSLQSCVTIDEFMEAVKILVAFTFQQEDQVVRTWYCDNGCRRISNLLCPGECNVDKNSKTICPFFIDEGLI